MEYKVPVSDRADIVHEHIRGYCLKMEKDSISQQADEHLHIHVEDRAHVQEEH